MTDADRYHIPPSLSNDELTRTLDEFRKERARPQAFVDLEPLIKHFESELSAARTAAADARCEARGHRERVVELEARLAEATKPRIELDYKAMLADKRAEWDEQSRRYVAQIKNLEKRAERAENKLAKAHCERDEVLERLASVAECGARDAVKRDEFGERVIALQAQLEKRNAEISRLEKTLADERARGRPIIATGSVLTPGTPAAVIEAYRLLVGICPSWNGVEWVGNRTVDSAINEAGSTLLHWLDRHAPGGKP